jgi:protein SCO1/2
MKRIRLFTMLLAAVLAACSAAPIVENNTAPPAHPFTLTDQNGKRYSVGGVGQKPAALYFGFTHCKDVCPQTLALLGRARSKAGITPQQLRIVMVTVDPARDTPPVLNAFVKRIGVDAYALTGSARQLRGVYRDYGVVVQPLKRHDIGHTDSVYLIDRHGRLVQLISPDTKIDEVVKTLKMVVH